MHELCRTKIAVNKIKCNSTIYFIFIRITMEALAMLFRIMNQYLFYIFALFIDRCGVYILQCHCNVSNIYSDNGINKPFRYFGDKFEYK